MKKAKKCALSLIIFFLIASIAYAEPSKPISKMMKTPASAFDVFLFQLHEQSKCYRGWTENQDKDDHPDLCMTTIKYDFDDNIIEMHYFVTLKHKKMAGFKSATDKKKEEILKKVLADLAPLVGVEVSSMAFKFGMIQLTPIRKGWGTKDFDESEIREEISKRTVIHLHSKFDGFSYVATRNHNGEIFFEKKSKLSK